MNIAYAVDCGLAPDFLDTDTEGKSSGIVAVHTLLGSAAGFALVIGTASKDFHFVYPIYIITLGLTCWLTVRVANEFEGRLNALIAAAAANEESVVNRKLTNEVRKPETGKKTCSYINL